MSFFEAFFLGLIQGLTEFLPVSSSGHLVIVPRVFGWYEQPLVFDTTLHLGTAFALIIYFRTDLINLIKSFFSDALGLLGRSKSLVSIKETLWLKIMFGSIPAGVIGLLLGDVIESKFRSTNSVALFLLLGSLLMYFSDKYSKRYSAEPRLYQSFLVGVFQALALFPGVSRSGATISGGLFFGLKRESAARFSFLLSIPIILLAGTFKLIESASLISQFPINILLIGFFSSFLSGLLAIKFMLAFLKTKTLNIFIAYRIILVLALLLLQ